MKLVWNRNPGQVEGEEHSNMRRVGVAGLPIGIDASGQVKHLILTIVSRYETATTKVYRWMAEASPNAYGDVMVGPDSIGDRGGWCPTRRLAEQQAYHNGMSLVRTYARSLPNRLDWQFADITRLTNKEECAFDHAVGLLNGTPVVYVRSLYNASTFQVAADATGQGPATYCVDLHDALRYATAWVADANRTASRPQDAQDAHDAAIDVTMQAIAAHDAGTAAATGLPELGDQASLVWEGKDDVTDEEWAALADARNETRELLLRATWAAEVDREQRAVLRREARAFDTEPPVVDPAVTVPPLLVPPLLVRADGKARGSNHGWAALERRGSLDHSHVWQKVFRRFGTGDSPWHVWITLGVEAVSPVDGLPLSWVVTIIEDSGTLTAERARQGGLRSKTAAQRWGEAEAVVHVRRNRERDRERDRSKGTDHAA